MIERDRGAGRPSCVGRRLTARPLGRPFTTVTRGVVRVAEYETDTGDRVVEVVSCNFIERDTGCYRVLPHIEP